MKAHEFVTEKWSAKYKRSINCSNPKGFSQKAHCAGRKKTNEDSSDWEFKNIDKLDYVLMSLCDMVIQGQKIDSDLGMVAACVIDPQDRRVMGINYPDNEGKRVHAERAAIENYTKQYGEIPEGSIVVTTLSPCTDEEMHERHGDSCANLISNTNVHKVYCGYQDPSQQDVDRDYNIMVTENQKIQALCKEFADTFLDEGRKRKKKTKSRSRPYYVGYGFGNTDATDAGDAGGAMEEDQHPNERPRGPEIKPTMPAGSVRVDVSDVYDWYKLGMHISDLEGLGKHDFGKGPPSTMFSFGSEEEEHEYIKALQKTGLTTTDIDPLDPNQPKDMPRQKTDPTFNVDENFADGKNPGRKGLAKRSGVNCKASVSQLRKVAKNSSGEKQRMAHWCANMKSGRKK